MIFKISHTTITTWDETKSHRLISDIAHHHHFISCDANVRQIISGFLPQELPVLRRIFDITEEQKKFLTIVDTSQYTIDQLFTLVREKSRLLIENAYEWPIHEQLAKIYSKDPDYGNVINMVRLAMERKDLYYLHGGGFSTYDALIDMEEEYCYAGNTFAMKHVIIFDRDTDNPNIYDLNKNALFRKLCGKESTQILDTDVYSLTQQPYIWHVWYKREIENYFSNDEYTNLGVKTYNVPIEDAERDYCKMNEQLMDYKKSLMKTIAKKTERKIFDGRQKKFHISDSHGNNYNLSEFQLLFLKIARII